MLINSLFEHLLFCRQAPSSSGGDYESVGIIFGKTICEDAYLRFKSGHLTEFRSRLKSTYRSRSPAAHCANTVAISIKTFEIKLIK